MRRLWVALSLVAVIAAAGLLSGCVNSSEEDAQTPTNSPTVVNSAAQTDSEGKTITAPAATAPAGGGGGAESGGGGEASGDVEAGLAVFAASCTGCHLGDGLEDGGVGPKLAGLRPDGGRHRDPDRQRQGRDARRPGQRHRPRQRHRVRREHPVATRSAVTRCSAPGAGVASLPMSLDVTTEARDGITLVILGGELDIYTVASFRSDLESVDPAASPLVIDLTDVTLLDSSGLGALVSLLNRARAGEGQLGLICPQRRLRRVFEITGLRRAFVFGDDLESVVAGLAAGPDDGTTASYVLDLKVIRAEPERVAANLARRGADGVVDELLAADERARALRTAVEATRAERARISKGVGEARRAGRDSAAEEARGQAPGRGAGPPRGRAARGRGRPRRRCSPGMPNLAEDAAPEGGEDDAVEMRRVGEPPAFGFAVRDHVELATAAGALDMEAAARVSGARFAYLLGPLVRLQFALVTPRARPPGGGRLHARRAAGAGARGGHVRHRLLPHRPGLDLRAPPTTTCTWSAPPRCPWPGSTASRSWPRTTCRCATAASRPASAARPAPPGATPAASSGCTSSTRSRCSRSCSRRTRRPSTSGSWACRRRSSRRSRCRTG